MPELTLDQSNIIKAVLASSELAMVAVDTSGSILFSNNAASMWLALATEPVQPETWFQHYGIYLPDNNDLTADQQSPLTDALAGNDINNLEVQIRNRLTSGRTQWCAISIRTLRDSDNQITGAVLLIQDINDRKKLADELKRSNAALQQFATVAAHDLQEPLRSIVGFAEMLADYQRDQLDEKSARCISKIRDGITRMQNIISDLLNYSRIQTKPQTLKQIDCNELMESCVKSLHASILENGGSVRFASLPTLMADSAQVSQLFQNLVGNALKFHAVGRTTTVVQISARRQKLDWLFAIEDNGIGIAPEFGERIFGVFQRLHNRTDYPGTGIGLAICQMIVDRHDGRLWVESTPGVGSTFYFTIPANSEDST